MEELITDWIPTFLRKTSEHEGNYWSVQSNLDGNGVRYGILQWTQKSGSLGRLLRHMAVADPLALGRFFGESWARLLDVLAQYAWFCAAKFCRTTAPERRNYNDDGNIWWSPVAKEWSELGLGAHSVRRVAVVGVWHAVTGPQSKPWSLYDLVTKRSSDILTDITLRDVAVDLSGARGAT